MKTAVVLGGYGFIGAACMRALRTAGFQTIGVGRSMAAGQRSDPDAEWETVDIAHATAADWRSILANADVVVNAAGALQDGARDDLNAIHAGSIAQLVDALDGQATRFIQISAAGATATASTEFLRSKARGDTLLAASTLNWVIFRPVLVFGRDAYGGTALLRAAAALPFAEPRMFSESPIQTVAVDDVAAAVVAAAAGTIPRRAVIDLTEAEPRSFTETVRTVRRWLGLPPWRRGFRAPRAAVRVLGRLADGLGWLGWRSPLRTTALKVLEDGVVGDPRAWAAVGGPPLKSFEATLRDIPATAQERRFAHTYLALPLVIGTLALFWLLSGAIGLWRLDAAIAVLTVRGMGPGLALTAILAGAVTDLALGLAVLYRPWALTATLGMAVVAIGYLVCGSVVAPDLWADPLGSFVKVLPAIALSLAAAAMLDER